MKFLKVKERQVKEVTMFLINKRLIFHPNISPRGIPNFENYYEREYILILDRNILTKLLDLCLHGTINDNYLLKVIGNIMFWTELNGVRITSGIALNEYAYYMQEDSKASKENNVFKEIFDYYSPIHWLDLAMGTKTSVPRIISSKNMKSYIFNVENDHYKMHYCEMLHIVFLLMTKGLNDEEKIIRFLKWNDRNLLFCQYTLIYASLLFTRKIKQIKTNNVKEIFKKCKNQAWDLTYLSFWSTLYWDDKEADQVYLFCTMDKDLKKIFISTHNIKSNPFIDSFGKEKGLRIHNEYQRIVSNRVKPHISSQNLNELIKIEELKIKKVLSDTTK